MRRARSILFSILAVATTQPTTAKTISDSWYETTLLGSRVGYYHVHRELREEDGRELVYTTEETTFALRRMNTEIEVEAKATYVETLRGEAVRFESVNQLAAERYTIRAERRGDYFMVLQEAMGKKTETEVKYSPDIIFPYTIEREIRASAMTPGSELTVRTFSPDMPRPTRLEIRCIGWEEVNLGAGRVEKLLRLDSKQELVPGVVLSEWRNTEGELVKTRLPLLGLEIISTKTTRDRALLAPESVEMLVKTLVDPKQELPQPRRIERATYRLSMRDGSPFPIELPTDRRQRVIGRTETDRVLEVERESWESVDEPTPRREYRGASSVLQSDDPLIQDFARKAGGDDGKPSKVARNISIWVHRAIEKKSLSVGLATAAEVARDLTGDCTEHAVLAAALARARGIPSKVAMGLVYINGVFGYHMWTEVFADGWHAIDPALGQAGMDATHIKLAESALDQGFVDEALIGMIQLISKLDIEIVEFEVGGKTFDASDAGKGGDIDRGTYNNALYGIRLEPPDGWRLLPGDRLEPDETLVRLEGPGGVRGELQVRRDVPRDFRLAEWVRERFDPATIRGIRAVTVAKKPGRRVLVEGDNPTALVAFLNCDTLYTLQLRPATGAKLGRLAEAALDSLVDAIELRKN